MTTWTCRVVCAICKEPCLYIYGVPTIVKHLVHAVYPFLVAKNFILNLLRKRDSARVVVEWKRDDYSRDYGQTDLSYLHIGCHGDFATPFL